MTSGERFPYPRPAVRPLKIYAYDPMIGRDSRTRISVDTRNEPLGPGPQGARIKVVDYDATHGCFYTPVDLNDPAVLMQGGIDHSEGDPRFHQQMVYAVAARVLEIFDRALGRPVALGGTAERPKPLHLVPHAFADSNAFFDLELGAVLFGYFRAGKNDPGDNLPGQMIYSCLSHDIIAHELTHALIERLAPKMLRGDHPDTYALHEGLADLVQLLHRFSFDQVLRDEIRRTRGNLDTSSRLVQVAPQFATAVGKEHGLRDATLPADPNQYSTILEPYERGSVLLSAVFEAFFQTYRARVHDLFLIAGTQWGPAGDELHPDLVNRIASEASRTALSLLTMCIRAFDYLPPVDVTFGDFLRAAVTADKELVPDDTFGQRGALIEACRRRGIYATGARSLAEESLMWDRPATSMPPLPAILAGALTSTAQSFRRIRPEANEGVSRGELDRTAKIALAEYARKNTRALHLSPGASMTVSSLRHSYRVAPNGQLVVEIIGQLFQRDKGRDRRFRAVTIVASADGHIRYVIPNQTPPRFEQAPAQTEHEVVTQAALKKPAVKVRGANPHFPFPFPARYRISSQRFRKLYPELTPSESFLDILDQRISNG